MNGSLIVPDLVVNSPFQTLKSNCKPQLLVEPILGQSRTLSIDTSAQSYETPGVQLLNSICQIRHPAAQWFQASHDPSGMVDINQRVKEPNPKVRQYLCFLRLFKLAQICLFTAVSLLRTQINLWYSCTLTHSRQTKLLGYAKSQDAGTAPA